MYMLISDFLSRINAISALLSTILKGQKKYLYLISTVKFIKGINLLQIYMSLIKTLLLLRKYSLALFSQK